MENLFVESNKKYTQGFILKEQDLRRLITLIGEQFQKLGVTPNYSYRIKFENGVVADSKDLESILKLENEGSSAIVRLEILAQSAENLTEVNSLNSTNETSIKIELSNINSPNELGVIPIKHKITGKSRDWVFVTSSLIEERINKISRKSFMPKGEYNFVLFISKILTPLILLTSMVVTFTTMPKSLNTQEEIKSKALKILEQKWKQGVIKDPIEVYLEYEKAQIPPDGHKIGDIFSAFFTSKFLLILVIGVFLTLGGAGLMYKYYPLYNFYWGGYIEEFESKETKRKIILSLVVGTIILGISINLLSNYIWEKI